MELKQYIDIILKRLWIVIAMAVLAAGISTYVNFYVLPSMYTADTTLMIINQDSSRNTELYNDVMVGQQLAKDYSEIIRSRTISEAVIRELGLKDITAQKLASSIFVGAKEETSVIQISVENKDPEMAMKIANSTAGVFSKKVVEIMGVKNVTVVDKAVKPDAPSSPRKVRNIMLIVVAGLIVGGTIAFLIEYMDNTIKTAEDIEIFLGINVIGILPERALNRGKSL